LYFRPHAHLMQVDVPLNYKWTMVLVIKFVQVFVLLFIMLNNELNMAIFKTSSIIQTLDHLFVVHVMEIIV
jgi:hypothetical protein